jgi:hypothetical protein
MIIEYMPLITVIVAVISLFVSLITHVSDRHKIKAYYSIYEDPKDSWNLYVCVSNRGKRPVNISFIELKQKGQNTRSYSFSTHGSERVDVGEDRSSHLSFCDCDISGLIKMKVFIVDALGCRHRARWNKY